MLKKQSISLSFKDSVDNIASLFPDEAPTPTHTASSQSTTAKNIWSGYNVKFRNPRNFQEYAIDKQFNRWADMVEFFKTQEKPYALSEGSLKDLLYGTYKRTGKHGLSLNDLVEIERIGRVRLTKPKPKPVAEESLSPEEYVNFVDADANIDVAKSTVEVLETSTLTT